MANSALATRNEKREKAARLARKAVRDLAEDPEALELIVQVVELLAKRKNNTR